MIVIKNILVATDFGEASDAALQYGRALAQRFGATLHVLHVTENLFVAVMAGEYSEVTAAVQEDLERAAQTQTEALLTDDDRRTLKAVAISLTDGSPAAAIVEYAKAARVDLIVLGTHGRGAVAHLFIGSVAERVVRTAPCPALTVHHPEHEFVLPDALVAVSRT